VSRAKYENVDAFMPHQKIFNFSFAAGHSHLCVFTYFWQDTPVCWEKCFLHHFPSEYDNFVCIYSFLFASMVQWWTLDIHWTFALGTRFLWKIVLPIIIMFLTLRKFFFFFNCSLKGSLRNRKWFFYGITAKTPFYFYEPTM